MCKNYPKNVTESFASDMITPVVTKNGKEN